MSPASLRQFLETGGGGMLITDDEELAARAKYLSTTVKEPAKKNSLSSQTQTVYKPAQSGHLCTKCHHINTANVQKCQTPNGWKIIL